jgi:hypothetical protein
MNVEGWKKDGHCLFEVIDTDARIFHEKAEDLRGLPVSITNIFV